MEFKHYVEIKVQASGEVAPQHLMNRTFEEAHWALVKISDGDMGVSFPDAGSNGLGTTLRVFGTHEQLERFRNYRWPRGLLQSLRFTETLGVPQNCKYLRVKRKQLKTNVERLRRRAVKRHNITYEEACSRYPKSVEARTVLPFALVKSRSSAQRFRVFISQEDQGLSAAGGRFSKYGLSQDAATVPHF